MKFVLISWTQKPVLIGDSFLTICDWKEEPGLVTDLLDLGRVLCPWSMESQVEPVRLLDPDLVRPVLEPLSSSICLVYSLSSKIFLSPPPGLYFTLERLPILLPTSTCCFSSWIWTLPPPGLWPIFLVLPTLLVTVFQSSFLFSILT